MATVNEKLRDAAIDHQVDMAQFANHEVRHVLASLDHVREELKIQLAEAIERLGQGANSARQVESELHGVRELLATAYTAMGQAFKTNLDELIEYELGYQYKLHSSVLPAEALAVVSVVSVSPREVRDIAYSRPFQGRLLSEWVKSLEADAESKIRDGIRIGRVEGLTTDQIVRRIVGTRTQNYTNGLLAISRRHAASVVRTAISHMDGMTREVFFAANADWIECVVWISTLDGRTSEGCRARDGRPYKPGNHKPIGHRLPWSAGPGRLHWNCRSSSFAVIKPWSRLGIRSGLGAEVSLDGQIPPEITFLEWLKHQSAARQDEVLGPTRGRLFRKGALKLKQPYDGRGRALTLEALRERNTKTFAKMG